MFFASIRLHGEIIGVLVAPIYTAPLKLQVGMSPMATLNLNEFLGTLGIGVGISGVIFGILTAQTYLYHHNNTRDGWKLKSLVTFVWIFEFTSITLMSRGIYSFFVTHYGNAEGIGNALHQPDLEVTCMLNGLLVPIIQAYFTSRIRRFSGKSLIPILCWTLSATLFALDIALGSRGFMSGSRNEWESNFESIYTTMLALGAFIDLIIASSLCYYLVTQRDPSFKRSVVLIDTLIVWTIQTGLLTSVVAVTTLIFLFILPAKLIWITFSAALSGLFPISLLASLNARERFRKVANSTTHIDLATGLHTPDVLVISPENPASQVTLGRTPAGIVEERIENPSNATLV